MKLLKGKIIADRILARIKADIRKKKIAPTLAVVLVGSDKASQIYVSLKKKAAQKVGIKFYLYRFSGAEKEEKIIEKIKGLNQDKKISGIIVQLPLPKKYNAKKIIGVIDPKKDVDGFLQKSFSQPVFPKAILAMILSSGKKLSGQKAIIIANSKVFGETMSSMLKKSKIKSEYILAGKAKSNLGKIGRADILITAVGKPGLITGDVVKKGVAIIDGGITKKGKKVLGDVDFESVKNKALYLTPVPGGVGPVTIACLLENVYLSAKKSR